MERDFFVSASGSRVAELRRPRQSQPGLLQNGIPALLRRDRGATGRGLQQVEYGVMKYVENRLLFRCDDHFSLRVELLRLLLRAACSCAHSSSWSKA